MFQARTTIVSWQIYCKFVFSILQFATLTAAESVGSNYCHRKVRQREAANVRKDPVQRETVGRMGMPNLTHETLRPELVGGSDGSVYHQLFRRLVAENHSVELESKSGHPNYHIPGYTSIWSSLQMLIRVICFMLTFSPSTSNTLTQHNHGLLSFVDKIVIPTSSGHELTTMCRDRLV